MKEKLLKILKILLFIQFFPLSIVFLLPKRYQKILLCIFLLLIGACYTNLRISRKRNGEKFFTDIVEIAKSRNILINKDKYKVKIIKCVSHKMGCDPLYGAIRKDYKFKSKYFDKKYKYYSFFSTHNLKLNEILEDFGLNFYILDEFIYDKSRGNNFEEIEKIFKSYKKTRIYFASYGLSCMTDDKKKRLQGEKIEIDYEKAKQECDERFSNYFREYFSSPTKIEEVDWEKYMEMNKIYPKLTFTDDNLTKAEVEELNEKIKPYYNKDLMNITIMF